MSEPFPALVVTQGVLTAVSAAFNLLYFAGLSTSRPARRIATLVLSLVNLSFLLQGLYWTLLPVLPIRQGLSRFADVGPFLMVGLMPLTSSLAIADYILEILC